MTHAAAIRVMNDIVEPTEVDRGGDFSLVQQLALAASSIASLAGVLAFAEMQNLPGLVSCGALSLSLAALVTYRLRG